MYRNIGRLKVPWKGNTKKTAKEKIKAKSFSLDARKINTNNNWTLGGKASYKIRKTIISTEWRIIFEVIILR